MAGSWTPTSFRNSARASARSRAVKAWADAQPAHRLFVSRITLAEIQYGIEEAGDPSFRLELNLWVESILLPWFSGRVLEVDQAVIVKWRRMVEMGRKVNHTFSQPDLFIAATAAVHGLGVATRNVEDFSLAGVAVVNPWEYRS